MRAIIQLSVYMLFCLSLAPYCTVNEGPKGGVTEPPQNAPQAPAGGNAAAAWAQCDTSNIFYANFSAAAWGFPVADSQIANGGLLYDYDGVITVAWSYCGVTIEKREFDGTLRWRKNHAYERSPMARLFLTNWRSQGAFRTVKTSDGGYAAVDTLYGYESGFQSRTYGDRKFVVLFRFSNSGNLLWKKDFSDSGEMQYFANGLLPAMAAGLGGSVFISVLGGDFATPTPNKGLFSVLKFDANGNLSWQHVNQSYTTGTKLYTNQKVYGTMYAAAIRVNDQGVLTVGGQISVQEGTSSESAGSDLYFVDLSPDNQILFQNRIVNPRYDQLIYDMIFDSVGNPWALGVITAEFPGTGMTSVPDQFLWRGPSSGNGWFPEYMGLAGAGDSAHVPMPRQLFLNESRLYPVTGNGDCNCESPAMKNCGRLGAPAPVVFKVDQAVMVGNSVEVRIIDFTKPTEQPTWYITLQDHTFDPYQIDSPFYYTRFPNGDFYFSGWISRMLGGTWQPVSFVKKLQPN